MILASSVGAASAAAQEGDPADARTADRASAYPASSAAVYGDSAGRRSARIEPAPAPRRAATLTADVALASANLWRGVTFTNHPVVQPDLTLTAPVPGHAGTSLLAGIWGNIEPARYAGARDVSMLGPDAATAGGWSRLTTTQLWTEVTQAVGARGAAPASAALTAIGGVLLNRYPRAGGLAAGYNSTELYARLATPNLPFAPRLSANVDVHAVRGTYLEAAVSRAVVSRPRAGVTLGAAAGWNAGMTTTDGAGRPTPGFFASNGLTHVDFSVAGTRTFGPVTLAPVAHLVLARDVAARQVAPVGTPHAERAAKVWLGTTLTWAAAPWTVAP